VKLLLGLSVFFWAGDELAEILMSRHLRLLTTAFLVVALLCGTALAGPGPYSGGTVDGDPDGPMRTCTTPGPERSDPVDLASMAVSGEGARADVQVKGDWWWSILRACFRFSGLLPR